MENKADVKAIMARFQASTGATEESSSPTPGRPKAPLNLALSSGPTVLSKKPVLESLSGGAITIPPKPPYLKNMAPAKSDREVHHVPNKTKALASRFDGSQDDSSNKTPLLDRGHAPMKTPPTPKPTLKPPLSTTLSNPKPALPKPPPAASKPSNGDLSPKIPPLTQKPSSSIVKLWQQNEAHVDKRPAELDKPPANPAIPPPKPPVSKKPSLRKPATESSQNGGGSDDTTSGPKRNPLPNSLTLGPAPAKPKRPPKVDLDDFRRAAGVFTGSTSNKTVTPTSSTPGNHSNSTTQPPQSALPSLPPRPIGTIMHQEESYDDVEDVKNTSPPPPPLPPSTAHPSQRAKEERHNDDSGDMYEPLDEPEEEERKKEKEEKRQQEAEKKEQKGQEKKEQEARKKFKLVGPLEALHQGKARVDCRGSRTELALKRGDCLDIVRVQGTPEGKWLGRKQDGSIGYVKTTSVEIDFDTLKSHRAQQGSKCDVYDDVDVASSDSSGISGQGVLLPPPPEEEGEIYNDIMDPDLDVRPVPPRSSFTKPHALLKMFERSRRPASVKILPPPSPFTADQHSAAAVDDEIYYDVDAQNQPPPPPISSIPSLKGKGKAAEESNPKKLKKLEKDEKEFRKKFKYDGEIRALYQVTIATPSAPLNKKWSGKELTVKAGEKVDVIVKAADDKMICRNEEGKFGYVSTCQVSTDDGDIYDDVGDDCIYDNE
ncbi:FYN-binding protein 1 isoform X2 [Dunckerocampus dactyliophorus]|uniref:FYN-binding protein 1 isoform X2 n=1 Tax=Dunckerocampus dactyliophorus TaxID=161453 RepID=UPI002406957E|nr:FYN-binding protein 1 isoform X2 [Dunckerocampus dactyliophorus]